MTRFASDNTFFEKIMIQNYIDNFAEDLAKCWSEEGKDHNDNNCNQKKN